MTKWWVWSTTEEHFQFAMQQQIWGSSTKNVKNYVKKGDNILIYVSKSFRGTCQVTGNWHENFSPQWLEEVRKNRVMWPWQCSIKPELIFNVKFDDVKKHLSFIKSKKVIGLAVRNSNSVGPANGGKPVDYVDIYTLKAFAAYPQLMKKLFDKYL